MSRCKKCLGAGTWIGIGFTKVECKDCDGTGKCEDNEKLRSANPTAFDQAVEDLRKADKSLSKEDAEYYLTQSVKAKKKTKRALEVVG